LVQRAMIAECDPQPLKRSFDGDAIDDRPLDPRQKTVWRRRDVGVRIDGRGGVARLRRKTTSVAAMERQTISA